MDSLLYNYVERLPGYEARAAVTLNSATVFALSGRGCFVVRDDVDIVPIIIDDKLSYVPWGGDNQMSFNIINLIVNGETLATCQLFNAEVCFGSGPQYDCSATSPAVKQDVEDFLLDNDLALARSARQARQTLALPQVCRCQSCAYS